MAISIKPLSLFSFFNDLSTNLVKIIQDLLVGFTEKSQLFVRNFRIRFFQLAIVQAGNTKLPIFQSQFEESAYSVWNQ